MPAQHLKHAKARAVESNKWVVRATLDGISQIISPRSKESSRILKRGEMGSITHEITLNDKDTFYIKYGDTPLLIISVLSLMYSVFFRKMKINFFYNVNYDVPFIKRNTYFHLKTRTLSI